MGRPTYHVRLASMITVRVLVDVRPLVPVATLVCVGRAAGDFGHNDEVPLGQHVE